MTITNAYSVRATGGPGRNLQRTPYKIIPAFGLFGIFQAGVPHNNRIAGTDPQVLGWYRTESEAEKRVQVLIEAAKGPGRPRYKLAVPDD